MSTPARPRARTRGRQPALDPVTERRLLLKAALAVLHRSDNHQVTLNEILREAGMSTRAFYRQFSSVSEVVTVLNQEGLARVCARLEQASASAASPTEALESWIDEILGIRYEPSRTRRAAVMRDIGKWGIESRTEVVDALVATLQPILEAGRVTGEFSRVDPHRDAWMICAITVEILSTRRESLAPASRADAKDLVLRFARGAMT